MRTNRRKYATETLRVKITRINIMLFYLSIMLLDKSTNLKY